LTAGKDNVPRASLDARILTVHKLKVLSRNLDHHTPTLKFYWLTHINTHPCTTTRSYTNRVKVCMRRKARTSITVPGKVHTSINASNTLSGQ